MIIEERLIGSTLISIENGVQLQPMILLKSSDEKEYVITISNDHRFIVSENISKIRE